MDAFLGRIKAWVWLLLLVIVILTTILVARLITAGLAGLIPLIPAGIAGVWMATNSGTRWFNRMDARKESKTTDYDAELSDLLEGKYDE